MPLNRLMKLPPLNTGFPVMVGVGMLNPDGIVVPEGMTVGQMLTIHHVRFPTVFVLLRRRTDWLAANTVPFTDPNGVGMVSAVDNVAVLDVIVFVMYKSWSSAPDAPPLPPVPGRVGQLAGG